MAVQVEQLVAMGVARDCAARCPAIGRIVADYDMVLGDLAEAQAIPGLDEADHAELGKVRMEATRDFARSVTMCAFSCRTSGPWKQSGTGELQCGAKDDDDDIQAGGGGMMSRRIVDIEFPDVPDEERLI